MSWLLTKLPSANTSSTNPSPKGKDMGHLDGEARAAPKKATVTHRGGGGPASPVASMGGSGNVLDSASTECPPSKRQIENDIGDGGATEMSLSEFCQTRPLSSSVSSFVASLLPGKGGAGGIGDSDIVKATSSASDGELPRKERMRQEGASSSSLATTTELPHTTAKVSDPRSPGQFQSLMQLGGPSGGRMSVSASTTLSMLDSPSLFSLSNVRKAFSKSQDRISLVDNYNAAAMGSFPWIPIPPAAALTYNSEDYTKGETGQVPVPSADAPGYDFEAAMQLEQVEDEQDNMGADDRIEAGRETMRTILDSPDSRPVPIDPLYLKLCTDGFAEERKLGEGAYSEVYMGKDCSLRRKFAVKRLRVRVPVESDVKEAKAAFEREVATLKHFRHPNIARLYAFFLSDDLRGDQCLVFELASNGSLHEFLRRQQLREKLHWTTRIGIALDIAKAIEYLHRGMGGQICFHRDIKSANVCLKRDFTALLIDCGVSTMIPYDESRATMTIMDSAGYGVRGTPGYICPMFARKMKAFSSPNDVFSMGIVFVELLTGVLQDSEVDGEEVDLFSRYSMDGTNRKDLSDDADICAGDWNVAAKDEFAHLAVECIALNPATRPKIEDIVRRLRTIVSKARPWMPGERSSMTVLFSAPLVWEMEGSLYPITESPNFALERDLIVRCMKEAKRDIRLVFDVATDDRLQAAATRRCGCLHFSGHGHPTHLLFEDGRGGAHWLGEDELHDLVHEQPFQFVFVSACYSGLMGKALVKAGVPHVVCCDHDVELMDDAALKFTQTFYYALAEGYTIQAAFDMGKSAVSKRFAKEEVGKFVLLPEDGDHTAPLFEAEPVEWSDEAAAKQFIPAPPQCFLGREIDMYNLLHEVRTRHMVSLIGETGIGCSSLASAVCHYISARKSTILNIEDIYFVRRGHGDLGNDALASFIKPLHNKLVMEGKAETLQGNQESKMLLSIFEALADSKALVVFDGADAEDELLIKFARWLFEKTNTVKLLVTAEKAIDISGVEEQVFRLGPLNLESTVNLFGLVCPHADSWAERRCLLNKFMTPDGSEASGTMELSRESMAVLIERLGGGVPSETIRAAKDMPKEEYKSIFG